MDVARFKYPPFWVSIRELWNSLGQKDQTTNVSRGYFVISTWEGLLEENVTESSACPPLIRTWNDAHMLSDRCIWALLHTKYSSTLQVSHEQGVCILMYTWVGMVQASFQVGINGGYALDSVAFSSRRASQIEITKYPRRTLVVWSFSPHELQIMIIATASISLRCCLRCCNSYCIKSISRENAASQLDNTV